MDKKYYDLAREEALDKETRNIKTEFFASDIDPKAIKLAKRHAERAGVADKIKFSVCDVKNVTCPLSNGTIITNPPYGERVFDREQAKECNISLGKLYKSLDSWSAFVITSANSFSKDFGKKSDLNTDYFNNLNNTYCKYKVKAETFKRNTVTGQDEVFFILDNYSFDKMAISFFLEAEGNPAAPVITLTKELK